MKDYSILKLLDYGQGLFERFGVDYAMMRRMLQVKLTMDRRRVPTVFMQQQDADKRAEEEEKDSNLFVRSLWLYGLLGLIMIPIVVMGDHYMFQLSLVWAILMFMITTSMISDFSSVLLDIRDKSILQTKPVSPRTIHMAKTVHIIIYLSLLTASMTLPSLVAGWITHGFVFFLLLLTEIVLADMVIVLLTALLYVLLLKFFDGERLKDTINYVQIALSIVIAVGYQVIIRSFELIDMSLGYTFRWWQVLLPPVWFAAPFELLLHGDTSIPILIMTGLALIVPILSILFYSRLMDGFERNLQKLANNSGGGSASAGHSRLTDWAARILCRSREERTFFRFTLRMLKGEREFKLKVYPSLGFAIIFPFIFMFNALRDMGWEGMAGSWWYISIYFSGIVIPTVALMLNYSGSYKGAWIYLVSPVRYQSSITQGVMKAAMVRLFAPIFLLQSVIFTAVFGLRIVPDVAAMLLSLAIYTIICFAVFNKELPFSQSFAGKKGSGGAKTAMLLVLLGGFVLIHVAALFIPHGIWIYLVLLLILNGWLWKPKGEKDAGHSKGGQTA
ncbi:hypothetical protein FHS18_003932 [Paenibacillus phyllosphaerae]|uniref:Uncharacterized protein n=1 Tax=Paenibacillus phyllosphaerae TaxID=274593 RepID=A0A7W5B0I8_9BACL|nr:hypothetical protein [Paenibacillus phyllosphaerae]MBB3111864.1 hypothetical protein [Paenibacillus phyllosphaerae]